MAKLTDMDERAAETVGKLLGIPFGLLIWAAKVAVACLIVKAILLS